MKSYKRTRTVANLISICVTEALSNAELFPLNLKPISGHTGLRYQADRVIRVSKNTGIEFGNGRSQIRAQYHRHIRCLLASE